MITVGKKGRERQVPWYYHRVVVALLNGYETPYVLDVETQLPGENEMVTARRLFVRLVERYGSFFDVVQGDAIYFESPFFQLCQENGKHILAVLKDNQPCLVEDAVAVLAGEPDAEFNTKTHHVKGWDQEGFTTENISTPFRVLRTEETTLPPKKKEGEQDDIPETQTWFWATSIPKSKIDTRMLWEMAHGRWKIENRTFMALARDWGLDHCFHHHPTAIINFLLILFIAHTLVSCFQKRNAKNKHYRDAPMILFAGKLLADLPLLKKNDVVWVQKLAHPPPR